uniref:Carboxyl-terminal-processing peptidase 2ic-like isoform X1 n=1 Tax=Rhizophora mucronata TaxID=61149 RepID=A0A2P2LYY1_RHIMU
MLKDLPDVCFHVSMICFKAHLLK